MKKIGIVTAHSAYNYGSKLQSYAMKEMVRQKGFEPIIWDVKYSENGVIDKIKRKLRFIRNIGCFYNLYQHRYIQRLYPNASRYLRRLIFKRHVAIDSFNKLLDVKFIQGDKTKIAKETRSFIAFFCGSDQVWRPIQNPDLKYYLLDFVDDSVRRIAYAPSLGTAHIPDNMKNIYRNALSKFYSLSCRETTGAEELDNITNKNVRVVLDPTLLVGKLIWDNIIDEKYALSLGNYCLCYLLGDNKNHRTFCKRVSETLKVPILNFAHFKLYNEADNSLNSNQLFDITPQQFIGLIKNAKFVVTDSFHCTAFSIMYHTQFATLQRYTCRDENSTNNRLYSLLKQINIQDRMVAPQDLDTFDICSKIDFDECDKLLELKRFESNAYINEALIELL